MARPPIEVTTFTVTPRDVPVMATCVAQTQSSPAVSIQARVSGFLDRRVHVEGSVEKSGQVLFQMGRKTFQTQVDAAAGRQRARMTAAAISISEAPARRDRARARPQCR